MMFPLPEKLLITAENHLINRYQLILMKIRSSLLFIIIYFFHGTCYAQDVNEKVLLTVAETKITTGEFLKMYYKNMEPDKPVDIDTYLQQYIIFKLKVSDALNEGLDTTKAFKNELRGYRNQLAQNYLTDTETKEKLLLQAYQRSLTEINAWHILIALPEKAKPQDTLKAWVKASDIRQRIIKGESFEQVARGSSDDQSVKINGGSLGFFTVFQMIMPFEDAAFSLKINQISKPVRTPYGYHIIRVTDKRSSRGRIHVAHIMKNAPPGIEEEGLKKAEEEINNVYLKLQGGASFEELAKKYSDHKESSVKGGELNWFGAGEMISDFSETAFNLVDTGSYTKPVRTIYGWHIIKLLEKKSPGSFEDSRSYLESRINQSYLNSICKNSFVEKLKKEYNFKINPIAFNWFVKNTDTLIIQGLKKYKRELMPSGNIYSFANQYTTTNTFASYIESRALMITTHDSVIFVTRAIETNATDHLINFENSVLENKYADFRYLMNEFHDGILLFEISGEKIWNKISDDSLGLHNYYEENKINYLSPPEIEAKIYTLKSSGDEKLFFAAYNKYSRKEDIDKRLIKKFNKKNDTTLIIKRDTWFKGDEGHIDDIKWVQGSQLISRDGFPSIIHIEKIIDPAPLKFEEVQGKIINDFQEYLDNNWIQQLKEKYSVKIDTSVLKEVKKIFKDE
jgi:peptidyl-prolyl cis-trans isomerase SurA